MAVGKKQKRVLHYLFDMVAFLLPKNLPSIAYLALIKARSVNFLIVDLFVIGIGSYGFITSNHVWVLSRCQSGKSERLKAINILGVASNLGLGLSAVVISLLTNSGFVPIFY
jgi:hypothetical protein